MIECLQEIEIDKKELHITANMYWEQSAVVRTELGTTIELETKKGVSQGCVQSASLLNLHTGKGFIFCLISFICLLILHKTNTFHRRQENNI